MSVAPLSDLQRNEGEVSWAEGPEASAAARGPRPNCSQMSRWQICFLAPRGVRYLFEDVFGELTECVALASTGKQTVQQTGWDCHRNGCKGNE